MSWSSSSGTTTPILYSYAFLRDMDDEAVAELITDPSTNILLDCGAFSALNAGIEIRLEDYIAFVQQWEEHLFGYIALDKLGDPAQTQRNLEVMLEKGLRPVPVHVRGDDGKRMDELFELSDWVAFGGLRRPHRGPADLTYLKQKMEWAAGRNVHWLGYTNVKAIAAFKPYSVDCSSWASALRWGAIRLYTGKAKWARPWDRSRLLRGERLRPVEAGVVRSAQMTEDEFYDVRRWNHDQEHGVSYHNSAISILPAHSYVRYIHDVGRWWGTRFFLAHAALAAEDRQPQRWARALYNGGRAALEAQV